MLPFFPGAETAPKEGMPIGKVHKFATSIVVPMVAYCAHVLYYASPYVATQREKLCDNVQSLHELFMRLYTLENKVEKQEQNLGLVTNWHRYRFDINIISLTLSFIDL